MPAKVIMPQGGQDMSTGRIVRWLKAEGDAVREGEVICEVETEKAVFEVSAPQDGYLLKILADEGQEVEILSTIAYVGHEGDAVPESESSAPDAVFLDSGSQLEKPARIAPVIREPKIKISPKGRLLARQHGLPPDTLKSSRPDGKITYQDVQAFVEEKISSRPEPRPKLENAVVRRPNRFRRVIAQRLSRSWTSAPHIFMTIAVDMDLAIGMRKELGDQNITISDLVICACARALVRFPEVNASFIDDDTIAYWEEVNIGLAVAVEDGLLVPVLAHADRLSLQKISEERRRLVEEARLGKINFNTQSHFTISNLGMHNVDHFTAVLNPPEAAILAVSSITPQAVPNADRQIEVRERMNITLSLDHRVGDGVLGAHFLNEIRHLLENPRELST
jgi:pyruvate dehydrogenase E2 component (dihydrolipoamide acetyltransferase)